MMMYIAEAGHMDVRTIRHDSLMVHGCWLSLGYEPYDARLLRLWRARPSH
jgi:hypothetical protein